MLKLFKTKGGKKSRDVERTAPNSGSRTAEEVQLPSQIAEQVGAGKSKFSVSHSGRYKAKHKQRVIIDDKFYVTEQDKQTRAQEPQRGASSSVGAAGKQASGGSSSKNSSGTNSANGSHKVAAARAGRTKVSEIEQQLAAQTTVTSAQLAASSHATAL